MISMVVAMAENRAIGKDNALLWHLPKDFKHFKAVTMGKPILMGRKTYESIGKPLPGRKNIVITRDQRFTAEGVIIVHSISEALEASKGFDEVTRLYVTVVHEHFEADAYFPEIRADEWKKVDEVKHGADEKHAYAFSFITYQRI